MANPIRLSVIQEARFVQWATVERNGDSFILHGMVDESTVPDRTKIDFVLGYGPFCGSGDPSQCIDMTIGFYEEVGDECNYRKLAEVVVLGMPYQDRHRLMDFDAGYFRFVSVPNKAKVVAAFDLARG